MSMVARFALPLIAPGHAQKEVYHNEALTAIDAVLHACVENVRGPIHRLSRRKEESWLVAGSATGAWVSRDDSLVTWTGGGWRFAAPSEACRRGTGRPATGCIDQDRHGLPAAGRGLPDRRRSSRSAPA